MSERLRLGYIRLFLPVLCLLVAGLDVNGECLKGYDGKKVYGNHSVDMNSEVEICFGKQFQDNCVYIKNVDTVYVHSQKMGKMLPNVVILPCDYSNEKKYPVIYLLHGYGDKYSTWVTNVPQIKDLATKYQVVVVCPEGGKGWYMDGYSDMYFESYIINDLLPFIESNYSLYGCRSKRAVMGQSMGGFGALHLALTYPDKFCAVSSISGAVNLSSAKSLLDCSSEQKINSSIINRIEQLKKADIDLIIDCGNKDYFYKDHLLFHEKMNEAGIDHFFMTGYGTHSWKYWNYVIGYHFCFMNNVFNHPYGVE